ncbi:hypothetical protein IKN40_02615 [bacterium]|nr:hypothetical protein [bacterium]
MPETLFNTLLDKYNKEHKDDSIFIGFLELDNGQYYTVSVYKLEGCSHPHLHIESDKVHCAIRLDKPKYYIHGKFKDTLFKNEIERFDELMNKLVDGTNITNWDLCVSNYNIWYQENILQRNKPDYSMLCA